MKGFIFVAGILGLLMLLNFDKSKKTASVEDVEEDVFVPKKRKIRKPSSVAPAERAAIQIENNSPRIAERNVHSLPEIPFASDDEDKTVSHGGESASQFASNYQSESYSPSQRSLASTPNAPSFANGAKGSSSTTPNSSSGLGSPFISGTGFGGYPAKPTTPASPPPVEGPASVITPLSCSSNIGAGAYGHPLAVSLTCTGSADISYCLGAGGVCCDPTSAGQDYSTPVVIGSKEGQYCLSFIGESEGRYSSLVNLVFDINNTYPDLEVTHPKTTYQTTQLSGLSLLASDDFSKPNFFIGQLNLKSHNPGIDGLNLDCEGIIRDYSSFTNPLVSMTLALFDMMGLSPTQQLEVPLNLSQLEYGENHITSYVVNESFAAPLYSCSTEKVVLNDFEVYQMDSFHREIGTGGVQEFTGGFSPYGIHDSQEGLRAPASVSGEPELEVGMLEILYQ